MSYTENQDVNKYIDKVLYQTKPVESPVAMILAGQPGAGKGSIAEYLTEKTHQNSITIDPDSMRRFHPDQKKLMQENDKTAASYTHEDASRWVEKLRDVAIENKRKIIIDGILKAQEKAEAMCKILNGNVI